MADELLKRIEAPQLNTAGYGNNISEQFNLIDLNFQSLANSDFFTGAQGKGLRLIKVETKSNPGLLPVFTFSENLKAHEDSILNNTDGEKLKKSIKEAFTNYIPSNTTWYANKEYTLYIEEPNNTVHNVYPIICMTEYEDVNGNKNQNNEYLDFGYEGSKLVLKPSSGFPSLYYDTTLGKFCWLINGRESGIAAQGSDGKNGERGPGLDFDVIEAETTPSDSDSFYKLKRVFWKNRMQRFYLDLSSTDGGTLGADGGYDEYDVEWLHGGREEWINNNKNRTFLVSRHIEEVKGEDGTTVIEPEKNVLHLCKLIEKSAKQIAVSNDMNLIGEPIGDVGEIEQLDDDIVVDEESASPVLMSTSVSSSSINQSYVSTVVKPPIFQVEFDEAAKKVFETEYKEVSTSVSNITSGKINTIQYISTSTGKIETVELTSTDKAQLAVQVANYAEDVYGVYLTDENIHTLSSTISAGSSSGISSAFDDIRWDQSDTSALRCMYLMDMGGNNPAGILMYNKNTTISGTTTQKLHLRHVDIVGNFSKGGQSNQLLEPDSNSGANLNIGTGQLEAGSIDLSGNLKAAKITTSTINLGEDNKAEIKFNTNDNQLNILNSDGVTINGSSFTKNDSPNSSSITTDNLTINKGLQVGNQLQIVNNNIIISVNNLHIDYGDTIELVSLGTPTANGFEPSLDDYGVKYCIDIPHVIFNFIHDKIQTDNLTHTYIGGNYNLKIRNISGNNIKYKITGYIDFCDENAADDIGHMIIDTYFNYNYNGSKVSIPYRADGKDDDKNQWALPFAGADVSGVSKQAIRLSSMSGPYMSFESVIVGNDKENPGTLKTRSLELPLNYSRIETFGNEQLLGIDGFGGQNGIHYNGRVEDLCYKLYNDNAAGSGDEKFTATFASPDQNTSNIPVYNKSVWITKTSY